jgi:hypothetical protein
MRDVMGNRMEGEPNSLESEETNISKEQSLSVMGLGGLREY